MISGTGQRLDNGGKKMTSVAKTMQEAAGVQPVVSLGQITVN